MPRQRQAANFGGTPVQHVEEHALSLLHLDRFSMPKHAAIDGERRISDLVTVRNAFSERKLHRRLAFFRERRYFRCWRQNILWHVAAPAESWLKFFHYKENFTVVASWLVFGFNVHMADLPAILTARKIGACAVMGVVKAV